MSTPTAGRPAHTARASSSPASIVRATVPWSLKATIVWSGMVFTVWGPMSESMYSVSGYAGFFVDVLAHNGRCTFAPRAASASHRGPLKVRVNSS